MSLSEPAPNQTITPIEHEFTRLAKTRPLRTVNQVANRAKLDGTEDMASKATANRSSQPDAAIVITFAGSSVEGLQRL